MKKDISVVVPAHNEGENLEALIRNINAVMGSLGRSCEIILIDDGSSDDTLPILKALAPSIPTLRILQHRFKCGQSAAIHTGVRAAGGAIIATLDGDGQNDPADIPRLLEALENNLLENLQMVAGFRKKRRDGFWKRFASRIANAVRKGLLRDDTPDTGCGAKVFYREAFLSLPYFDHMHRFLPALIRRQGGEVVSVEVRHHPREHGSTHYGNLSRLGVGIVDLGGVLWLKKRSHVPEVREIKEGKSNES